MSAQQIFAIGLDVGTKTIGLARSDATGLIASPWQVLPRTGNASDASAIAKLTMDNSVGCIVVGMPFELDGSEGLRARRTQVFVGVLRETLAPLPSVAIHLWDERFSSKSAERTLLEINTSRAKRKQKIDAFAAQFILQGFLDGRPQTWQNLL